MAGHFVLWRMANIDKNSFLANFAGSQWTALAHSAGTPNGAGGVFPGWTNASRNLLNELRNGISVIPNRNDLPPHRYLHIPPGILVQQQIDYLQQSYWINDLQRPSAHGFGVVALSPGASNEWNMGRKLHSLKAQIAHGATSIEIYYLDRNEMV